MRNPSDHESKFIESLNELVNRQDRGALAALRRGLGKPPGSVAEMHRYVAPWLPEGDDPFAPRVLRQQDAWYLVAALFALHPDHWRSPEGERFPRNNFGASCQRLTLTEEGKRDEQRRKRIERRFVALLNCHTDDLGEHLRRIVGLLKSSGIPINWAQLLVDIQDWANDDRSVQRGWAQAFWGGRGGHDADAASTTLDTSEQPAAAGR